MGTLEILESKYVIYGTRGLKCEGCNLGKDYYSDGYRSFPSGLFFHKECSESRLEIYNLYHPQHSLRVKVVAENEDAHGECRLCRGNLSKMYYYCSICDFAIDLICAKKEVITTIMGPETHEHCLSLIPEMIRFTCHLCGFPDDRFPYVCNSCDLSFHKDCAESKEELNYSCHPKHPLKRLTCVPSYTDGKCCLCGNTLHIVFYHCSICNFSVDVNCSKNPPAFTLVHPKAHEHKLILMPQRSFLCNAYGLDDDDPNPYVCPECNFMIHRNCIDIPRVIRINRHVHRIHYNHCLDAGNWKCGVCHKLINWTCGAYSCSECPDFASHLRCATKFLIWDGIDLEGISKDAIEVKSYEVIQEGVIKHFIHGNHVLKLKGKSDDGNDDECMWCKACSYPIYSSPFYSCMECDDFILHQKCAYLPKKKIDPFYKMEITLKREPLDTVSFCEVCRNLFRGFRYGTYRDSIAIDVRCGSITEPFVHESHPLHSLYISYSTGDRFCNACGDKTTIILTCEECEFVLDIKCSVLPKMVKHNNDKDHFLSLCYGEKTSEEYWCEICEEQLNPEKWFYSCDQCAFTLHIKCTLGDFIWFKPEREAYRLSELYVILNNFITRPVCQCCGSRCQFSSIANYYGFTLCSLQCFQNMYKKIMLLRVF